MEYRTLGRTGLSVSVMGIGAGGAARLGKRNDINTEAESIDIVLKGLDAGINFIDTAEAYGTEEIVGKAVAQRKREDIVISTKASIWRDEFTPEKLTESLENSLRRLQTDYVDVYHLHGVSPAKYDACLNELVPVLQKMQQQGKVRFIGVTEAWNSDKSHEMLKKALESDVWDVFMIGFNLLNQTARETVLQPCIEKNIGTLIMFAVRTSLAKPENLRETVKQLIADGELDPAEIDPENPLGFLLDNGIGESIPDIAYRFCREEPGTHVILSGTSNPAHMQANLDSLTRPELSDESIAQLKHIFRNVKSLTGQ